LFYKARLELSKSNLPTLNLVLPTKISLNRQFSMTRGDSRIDDFLHVLKFNLEERLVVTIYHQMAT
jgi:hypothetical protein